MKSSNLGMLSSRIQKWWVNIWVRKPRLIVVPDFYVQEMQKGIPKRCDRIRRKVRNVDAEYLNFRVNSYSDEYCPHCDNHFIINAVTPKAALKVESEDTRVDARSVLLEVTFNLY